MRDMQKYIETIVLFVLGINYLGGAIDQQLNNHFASNILSAGIVSLIIYFFYILWDRVLWRWKPVNKIISILVGFYEYPILDGIWEIQYNSSQNNITGVGSVQIKQSYSTICLINGKFNGSSRFESFSAHLDRKVNDKWFLTYAYKNRPDRPSRQTAFTLHEGFCYLDIIDENKLEGFYANDQSRQTQGNITLIRI